MMTSDERSTPTDGRRRRGRRLAEQFISRTSIALDAIRNDADADAAGRSDSYREEHSMQYEELVKLDLLRKAVARKSLEHQESFTSILIDIKSGRRGNLLHDVFRAPLFWAALVIYVVSSIWLPFDAPSLGATVVGVLGGYISFAALFLNNQSFCRYYQSYGCCVSCQGRIFDTTTMAKATMRPESAALVTRYMCAAFLMAFVGLAPDHYTHSVLEAFVVKHELLTDAEWDALLAAGPFTNTGNRYRELVSWIVDELAAERDAGRCHPHDAELMMRNVLGLRSKLAQNYDMIGRPVPYLFGARFFYVYRGRAFALSMLSRARG